MELRHLRYFIAVARHAHFTRAAKELAIAQPALSQQIAQFEREIGVRLFDRSNRRVQITDAGRALLARALRIVADADSVAEEMSAYAGGLRGRVVVGTIQSLSEYTLPKILKRFHGAYPHIEIALRESLADTMIAGMRGGSVDLAIGDMGEAAAGTLREMRVETLFTDELTIAVAPSHRFAERTRIEVADLCDEPFIIFRPGSALTNSLYEQTRAAGFEPRVTFESTDSLTVRALVAENLGVTLLPRSIGTPAGPKIVMLSLAPRKIARTISLVHRASSYGPAAKTFIGFVREQMRR